VSACRGWAAEGPGIRLNHYDADARLGLHRDSDEAVLEPVVSLSLGAACLFRLGNTEHRGRPWTDVELHSGDLLVFGDESRLAYHGVPKLLPGIEVPDIGLAHGRLNITLRVSGMAADACGSPAASPRRWPQSPCHTRGAEGGR
jgi:alkylated DNA repair protein (DNA oxidative demethylase)